MALTLTERLAARGVVVRESCECGLCRKARGLEPLDKAAHVLERRRVQGLRNKNGRPKQAER